LILNSECELGLDVYAQLLSEGCTPNLVTYNILIDAYSRTGQWAKAADVLDPIARQSLTPEARTYNSIISACGKAGQPASALRVYERMLADGVEPTSTTYTSVISAFGRAGQVDEALQMYRDMSSRGCEPNVITYSSLISVCERAGRAEAALELFDEMKTAGVRPNVVTFNGLVAACAHSGMWQKAAELVEAMHAAGCRPDGTTYSALVAAFESGGQWRQALQALEKAQAGGVRPDAGAYNAVLGALWSSGRLPALAKAVQLLAVAQRQGALRMQSLSAGEATATAYTQGAAILIALRWLCHFREGLSAAAAFAANPAMRSLVLTKGKHADPNHSFDSTRDALNSMFTAFSVPANALLGAQGLVINADARVLPSWAVSPSGLALLSVFDFAAGVAGPTGSQLVKEDRAAEVQCGKAFAAVREFENTCKVGDLDPEALCTPTASALRHDIISCITALCGGLQLREDTAHDAVQLCNRLLSLAPSSQQPPAPACAAALLLLACRQAGNASAILRHGQLVLQGAGLPVSAVLEAEHRVLSTLGNDSAAISPLRVLHLYLERLGCDDSSLQKCQLAQVMALTATDLVAKAALSPAFIRIDPSLVAAACLHKARQSMGLVPSWPSILQDMTGYLMDPSTGPMNQCVELMQLYGIAS
jgi:pentatricopeptide repeat domain-containing protein 1